MINAIISTILGSFATIFRKKSLNYKAPSSYFLLMSYTPIILISFALYLLWQFENFNFSFTWFTIFIIFLIIFLGYFNKIISQKIYSVDKISVLAPYENINRIISIIFWFILFWDISVTSLFITILTVFVIIWFTIDFKTLKLPKSIKLFAFSQLLVSIALLLTWFLLKQISNIEFFVLNYIVWIIFILFIFFRKKDYSNIWFLPKKFYAERIFGSHLWWLSYLMSLIIIKSMWISVSILLSFVWIWITLFLSYIILKDKPSKKDLFLTFIVTFLVWLWYYFK